MGKVPCFPPINTKSNNSYDFVCDSLGKKKKKKKRTRLKRSLFLKEQILSFKSRHTLRKEEKKENGMATSPSSVAIHLRIIVSFLRQYFNGCAQVK